MESNVQLLMIIGAAFSGSVVGVWAVFSVMVAGIVEDVREVKASVLDAHRRINKHIESHR